MNLFDHDSSFMQALTHVGNMILLNIVFLLCSLPVVTLGASATAMYTVTLAMAENREQGFVLTAFFRAFARNWKQATVLWLILLVFGAALALDWRAITVGPLADNKLMTVLFFVGAFFYLPTLTFVFPVLAKFDNTVLRTLKNSMALGISKLPQAILMTALNILPLIILYFNQVLFFRMLILWIVIAFAAIAQLNSYIFRRIFRKLLEKQQELAEKAQSRPEELPGEPGESE